MTDPAIVQDGASSVGLGDAGKRVMEQYGLEKEISKAEKAQSVAMKAGEAQIMSQYGSVLSKPYEEFKPSQESASGFAALGSLLMVAGGMMGGKGRLAGIGAMNNIAGMMKGYQQGRKDLYEQERTQFEDNMKVFEKNRTLIKEAFDRALKMAPYNLTTAQNNLRKELAGLGASIPAEMTAKSGLVQAVSQHDTFHTNTTNTLQQLRDRLGMSMAEEKAIEADVKAEKARKELAAGKNPIKIQFEGKTVLADPVTYKPLRDDKGDVIEPGTAARTSAQNQQIQRRLATATTQAVEAFKAITDMPPEATTGIIPFLGSKEGVISYIKSATGRALSPDEANVLNTYFKGVARNLATIEASGVATGLVGLANSFESLAPMSGDSDYAVAAKLAEGRAVIENGIRVALTDLSITDEQKALLKDCLKGIQEAIPYTRKDLNQALKAKSDTEGTLGTSTASVAKPDANLPKPTTDAEFNALPKGSRYIDPDDGKIYVK